MTSKATRPGGQGSRAIAIQQPLWNLVQNVLGCPDFKSKRTGDNPSSSAVWIGAAIRALSMSSWY
jgi:hypothetical protein